jgi:poly-gamma-glutamate synthesis protein (capsule biosynthesis protein)
VTASSSTSTSTSTTTTTTTLPPPRTATLAFTGDLLPHGPVVRTGAMNQWDATGSDGWDFRPMFDEVRPILSAADLAICHLESPVSSTDTNLSGYPVFNAPRAFVEAAVDAGYDGCSTASNHAFDRGGDGVRSTVEVFEQLGISQAGMAKDAAQDLEPVLYEVNGMVLAHISATYSLNGFVMPDDEQFLVDLIEPDDIIAEAALAKAAGAEFVIVSLHWGNEYQQTPSAAQDQWLAEILPSDEVDLVIGHHAHVVQPIDKVGDEWVVFGLGNFLSNQSANCCVAASQDGMIAHVTLVENELGEIEVDAVSYTPTWVDRSDGYVIRVANGVPGREGIADVLATSAARTADVVMSRLGPADGLTERLPG